MYNHLTKGEKKKKLAQARKRAILWSSQELRKKQLHDSTPAAQLPTTTEPRTETTFYPATSEPPPDFYSPRTPTKSAPIDDTIAALQASLADLYFQREQIDISIQVLQRRLDALKAQQS